jgi:hypothetical protein
MFARGPWLRISSSTGSAVCTGSATLQPSGFRPEIPDLFYQNNIKGWGPPLCAKAPGPHDEHCPRLPDQHVHQAPTSCSVSRDLVRSIQMLIAPDDVPAHPHIKVAREVASLAPRPR